MCDFFVSFVYKSGDRKKLDSLQHLITTTAAKSQN